jgi:hypothetical protein
MMSLGARLRISASSSMRTRAPIDRLALDRDKSPVPARAHRAGRETAHESFD